MLQKDLYTTMEREWDGYILLQVQLSLTDSSNHLGRSDPLHASLHYVSLLYHAPLILTGSDPWCSAAGNL